MANRCINPLHNRPPQTCLWAIEGTIFTVLQAVEKMSSGPLWVERINIYGDYHASFGDV